VNSLITDTDIRERLLERPAAALRLQAERSERKKKHTKARSEQSILEAIAPSGAIIVVGLGLAFVFVITLVSLGTVPDEQKAPIVTAAFTVLGTIVGAYFGVRVGAAGKGAAEKARDAETIKVQELTARVDPVTAITALDSAHRRIERS
jgi:hypothetical protein